MCDVTDCQNDAEYTIGTINLCETHVNAPRTACRSCARTVAIAGTVFVNYTPYGAPSNIALCDACDLHPRVACERCTRIVTVNAENIAGSSTFGAPSNLTLCTACNDLARVSCRQCNRMVSSGGTNLTGHTNFGAPSNIALCTACNLLPRVACQHCAKIVTINGGNINALHTFGAPSNIVLCADCVDLDRVTCRHCTRVLSVDGTNVTAHTNFGAPSNISLCAACVVLPRLACTLCARILRVDNANVAASTTYADGAVRLCATCNPLVAERCRACSTPAAYTNDTDQVVALPNASFIHAANDVTDIVGWRCSVCTVGPLTTTALALTDYNAAVTWMTGWLNTCGVGYPAYGARLEWSIDRDGTFAMTGGGQELGHCVTTTPGDGSGNRYRIRVLFYMRPISFQQTLVHELTHALTNERGIGNKPLIEGFCNYVSYLFLTHVSQNGTLAEQAEALRALARMEASTNVIYGVNFRAVRDLLANQPTQALTWLAST